MFTRFFALIVRVLIGLLLLIMCQFHLNILGVSTIYAKSSDSAYELYKQLMQGKRILPDKLDLKAYITPQQPTVYLTFDDGPSVQTPKVLDILQKENIKASFFVVGKLAEEHPEWVKQAFNAGHTIGNHSYNHVYKQLYGNIEEFWRQIQQTEKILYEICGIKPKLVRAPGGTYTHFNAFYYYDMDRAGYTVLDWNMDSADSSRVHVSANEIVTRVKQSILKHEVILLMHDGSGHNQTVQALPEIIHYFKKMGYAFAPLTTKVKPVQSPLAKKIWTSTYSYAQFIVQEDKVSQFVAEREKQVTEAKQRAEALRLLALEPQIISLNISYNNKNRILQPEEYAYKENKLNVPLQELASVIGANLVWDNLAQQVTAYYGQRRIEYHLDKHTMVAFEPNGKMTIYGMQSFIIRNGRLEVPLRSTVESLGNYIGDVINVENLCDISINEGFATQIIMDCSGIFTAPLGENAPLQG